MEADSRKSSDALDGCDLLAGLSAKRRDEALKLAMHVRAAQEALLRAQSKFFSSQRELTKFVAAHGNELPAKLHGFQAADMIIKQQRSRQDDVSIETRSVPSLAANLNGKVGQPRSSRPSGKSASQEYRKLIDKAVNSVDKELDDSIARAGAYSGEDQEPSDSDSMAEVWRHGKALKHQEIKGGNGMDGATVDADVVSPLRAHDVSFSMLLGPSRRRIVTGKSRMRSDSFARRTKAFEHAHAEPYTRDATRSPLDLQASDASPSPPRSGIEHMLRSTKQPSSPQAASTYPHSAIHRKRSKRRRIDNMFRAASSAGPRGTHNDSVSYRHVHDAAARGFSRRGKLKIDTMFKAAQGRVKAAPGRVKDAQGRVKRARDATSDNVFKRRRINRNSPAITGSDSDHDIKVFPNSVTTNSNESDLHFERRLIRQICPNVYPKRVDAFGHFVGKDQKHITKYMRTFTREQ